MEYKQELVISLCIFFVVPDKDLLVNFFWFILSYFVDSHLKNPDRCTFQYNIKAPCIKFTGDPINLDDLLKGNEFLEMPFYSVVLIFHEEFEVLFDSRINLAKKIPDAKNDSKSESKRTEKHFPCDKLNTDILKKIENIKLGKLNEISLKIVDLNSLCNDAKKSN